MAKSDAPETSTFNFGEFSGTDKPGKYDAEVEALIDLNDNWPDEKRAAGIRPTITLNFPLTQTNSKGVEKEVVGKYRRYFQESAKSHNRTAREVNYTELQDGSVNVTFVLTDKITRPRKPKDEAAPAEDTVAETA